MCYNESMFKTIVALATPPLKSALAIIRLSGNDAFEIVSKCFTKKINTEKKEIYIGDIYDEETIDNVVVLAYKAPRSFTGENVCEIICHGSMLIANEIINVLVKHGAVMAKRGEFSQRAFLNNKINLVQAESINDIINAETHEAKRLGLMSLKGETTAKINLLKEKFEDLLASIEVHFDYPEEADSDEITSKNIIAYIDEILDYVSTLINEANKGRIINEGIKVALVGKPNVGKSSLLNALLNENKAIVTDIAGTTRDVVEGEINIDGVKLKLLDTAGIRGSDDIVEVIGINKSKETINAADLVVVVLDASNDLDEQDEEILRYTENKERIVIYNKSDKIEHKKDGIYVSALNNDLDILKKEIFTKLGLSQKDFLNPSLVNDRQIGLLEQMKQNILKAKEDAYNMLPVDLISISILSAYNRILDILGESTDIDISKEIFKRFCVGK